MLVYGYASVYLCIHCNTKISQIWVFMAAIRQVLEAAMFVSTGSKGTAMQKPGNNAFGLSCQVVHKNSCKLKG